MEESKKSFMKLSYCLPRISLCDIDVSDKIRMPQSNIFLRADGLAGGLTPLSKKEQSVSWLDLLTFRIICSKSSEEICLRQLGDSRDVLFKEVRGARPSLQQMQPG